MSRTSIALLLAIAGMSAHAYTLGEAEDAQGRLARAKMEADIADSEANTRLSSATLQPPDPTRPQRASDPARDFAPYGFYQFGPRTCADVVFREVLYTRCVGDAEGIDGWTLLSLTQQKAVFGKAGAKSVVVMGVTMASPSPDAPGAGGTARANPSATN